jgi:dolichol-phosphate mannosyltransferase
VGCRTDQARHDLGGRELTVVVPVYNEGANLRRWYAAAADVLPSGTRVRVVYDFDGDDTLPVVAELSAAGAPIEALRSRGKGALEAIVTGLRSADRGAVLVSMADLSDDFSALPRMLEAHRAGAAVVVASRYMPGGRQLGGPWLKGQLSRWGGRSLHVLAGFPVQDATNSFRLYDAAFLRTIEFESTGGFEIGFEITLKAWEKGLAIAEVPCTWRGRVAGTSRFALAKWLPLYGKLWGRAVRHGVFMRLGLSR